MNRRHFQLLGVVIGSFLFAAAPARANFFFVTSAADADNGHCFPIGGCTLRDAINAANADGQTENIVFVIDATITLGSTLPAITAPDVTIDSNGFAVTVSGNNSVQVMRVNSGVTLTLQGLTIASGAASGQGGGIYDFQGIL